MAAANVSEFIEVERQLKELMQQRDALASDESLKGKVAALKTIVETMESAGLTPEDVANHLGIGRLQPLKAGYNAKNPRTVKEYVNPHTSEVFSGKKVSGKLKDWIAEYGEQEVETWRKA
jgi:DNA-binding protein H-NS